MMIVVGAIVLQFWPATALAQEHQALDLTLTKTYIKTTADVLTLAPPLADAFTPTSVRCPGNATCLLRVEVNTAIAEASTETGFIVCLRIGDGPLVGLPTHCHFTAGEIARETYAWALPVAPGVHAIRVRAGGQDGPTSLTARMLTIEVLKSSVPPTKE
jgi:hypothetical protein